MALLQVETHDVRHGSTAYMQNKQAYKQHPKTVSWNQRYELEKGTLLVHPELDSLLKRV